MIRHNILTNSQARDDFIQGVHLLKQEPWTNGLGVYDFFVYWHHQAMMERTPNPPVPSGSIRNAAHRGPVFLPWHRYMMLALERELRRVLAKDDFRLPYWSWTADAADPVNSALWGPQVMGGTGSPVGSGPFQRFGPNGLEWEIRLAQNPNTGQLQQVSRGLRRDIATHPFGTIPDTTAVNDGIALSTYDAFPWDNNASGATFRQRVEGPLHDVVHVWVGNVSGDMSLGTSPNDPVFFLHHANIDRIWRAWQERVGMNVYLPLDSEPAWLDRHRLNDMLHNLFGETVSPADMLDVDAQYTYDTLTF